MTVLSTWQLDATAPYVLQLAADARISYTDYTDDQIWELLPGILDNPALQIQTRYGGRVGLASLVPMWMLDGRSIYQAQTYTQSPQIVAFAPGYARLQAALTPEISLIAEYWVMESHAVGARYTLHNSGSQASEVQAELFAQVGTQNKRQPLAVLTLATDSEVTNPDSLEPTHALSFGRLPNLTPVVVMEGAGTQVEIGRKASPKIASSMLISGGESQTVRWVHAGLPRLEDSLNRARFWLAQDWDAAFALIDERSHTMPRIETGDSDDDATIAFSVQQIMQAFSNPTTHLPYASFIANREMRQGYSPRGDGSDYGRGWQGQNPQSAYLLGSAAAVVDPTLAQGVLRNYLAVQAEDGNIDAAPGLGGQRAGMLCPPVLARLAWNIYGYSGDKVFLEEVYGGLLKFFNHWFEKDYDADNDAIPEWQDERQTGYVFWPTFGAGQAWAQGADIRQVESPDLAAYLLSEAEALREIATVLENPGAYELQGRINEMLRLTERMWYAEDNRYAYQDRDTGMISGAVTIVENAPGDEEQLLAMKLESASRLIVRVMGGTGRAPRAEMILEGLDADGNRVNENINFEVFDWRYGVGTFTSAQVYTTVDRINFTGLSRVYRFSVQTVDFTRLDINAVLPLMVSSLPAERAEALVDRIMDEAHFLRPAGLTIVSAQDPNFDPSSAAGGGGTWTYWTTLITEGLIAHGRLDAAAVLLKRLLSVQTATLKKEKRFREFYHSDVIQGLGDEHYITGAVPLHVLLRVIGVQILDLRQVRAGGPFVWGDPVTVNQHGVTVTRDSAGTHIRFASGNEVKLPADAPWQLVVDTTEASISVDEKTLQPIFPPEIISPTANSRVIIEVEDETSHDNT